MNHSDNDDDENAHRNVRQNKRDQPKLTLQKEEEKEEDVKDISKFNYNAHFSLEKLRELTKGTQD